MDIQDDDNNSDNVIGIENIGFEGAPAAHIVNNPQIDTTEFGKEEKSEDYTEVIALYGAPPEATDVVIHDIIGNQVEHGMSSLADHMEAENDGFAIVYAINDIHVPIAPHTHYWYRSKALAHLSLIEHCSVVKVVRQPPQSDDDTVTRGRCPNGTYLLHPDHPLLNNYYQKLRSKQATPISAGAQPLHYPGNKPQPCTELWVCKFQPFLIYYLTVFCPCFPAGEKLIVP